MKYLLSFLFILICFNLSAQSKWSVGIVGGVDVAATIINPERISSPNGVQVEERSIVAPRYGFNFGYRISDRVELKSGIRYNNQGEELILDNIRWGSNQGNPTDLNGGTSTLKNRFIEIPLHIKMNISNGKLRWFVEGGVSPNIYVNTKFIGKFEIGESFEDVQSASAGFRKFTGSVDLGFGLEKNISDKINVSIQPMFRYYPLSISDFEGGIDKSHFYNVGLEVGCSYVLGK